MSSKTTGENRCPDELSETTRAPPAAASDGCTPTVSAKWPRWLVANCASQPASLRVRSWIAITPALLIKRCSGSFHPATNAAIELSLVSSSGLTSTFGLPVSATICAATFAPESVSRTARVTAAPRRASVLAVSMPIPDAPPVTIARLPVKSTPSLTSSAVDWALNGVVIGMMTLLLTLTTGEAKPSRGDAVVIQPCTAASNMSASR